MTKFINIKTEKELNEFIELLKNSPIKVVDTETNGLNYYREHEPISLSVYFPDKDTAFNFAWKHGHGSFDLPASFEELCWQNKAKKLAYLAYWFNKFPQDFGNCPIDWLEKIKVVWGKGLYIGHNIKFDLHMLNSIGFPLPDEIEDTLIALHLVNEDWRGLRLEAPYQERGVWAKNPDGTLKKKLQSGNKQLKWVCAYLEIEDATRGEEMLQVAIDRLRHNLATFIMQHLDDPYNADLRYRTKVSYDKQYERILSKLQLDPKSHLWMLPSDYVAVYAMLDVVLTWKLRSWCLSKIIAWDNLDLYKQQCAVMRDVTFRMECNGMLLDYDNAVKGREQLLKEFYALEDKYSWNLASARDIQTALRDAGIIVPNTRSKTLKNYKHEIIDDVLQYRKLSKAANTYLSNWINSRDKNNIIRSNFNETGTVTGRLSSSGAAGNLQNIPDRHYTIKSYIIAPDNYKIVALDYGQLEARLASWIAEDLLYKQGVHNYPPTMLRLFNEGVDLHAYTRDMANVQQTLFGDKSYEQIVAETGLYVEDTPENAVKSYCRFVGKTMNFGLLYGGTKRMLSQLLDIDLSTADILVHKWRELFPAFTAAQNYYADLITTRRRRPDGLGYGMYVTQPISKRHRKIHMYPQWIRFYKDGQWQSFNPQEQAARKAWNAIVQGLGGWLTPNSLLVFGNKHGWDGIRPFAIIHDAIELYVHEDYMWKIPLLVDCMTDYDINPRLTVDVRVGDNWQHLRRVKNVEKLRNTQP